MNVDQKIAQEKIDTLRAERDYYKTLSDLAQEALQEREEELRAAKGQIQNLLKDCRYVVA